MSLIAFMLGSGASLNVASAQTPDTIVADVQVHGAPVAIACPVVLPSACLEPEVGNTAVADVDFGTRFTSLESLCFTVHFEGNLLDPGEAFLIDVDPDDPMRAFGAENIGPAAISERTVCLETGFHDQLLSLFLDGDQTIRVFMFQGSATISDVEVVATGVVSNVKAGKGCGDKNHLHQREDECKREAR